MKIKRVDKTIATQYDKMGETYQREQRRFYASRKDSSRTLLYRELEDNLEGKIILDVGCGFGKDLQSLSERGALVYGIDASEKMVQLARINCPEMAGCITKQNFHDTDFTRDLFDIIFSRYTLNYSSDVDLAYQEFHRILKPNGILLFAAAHPLVGFINKKEKVYWKKEIVSVSIYDNNCTLDQPTQTFGEWLSPFFLQHFELLKFLEHDGEGNSERSTVEQVPDFLMMKAKKRKTDGYFAQP